MHRAGAREADAAHEPGRAAGDAGEGRLLGETASEREERGCGNWKVCGCLLGETGSMMEDLDLEYAVWT